MLAELLSTVADAVLGYALEKLDPADRLREWLKRDPAKLAYQKALARAYTAFARQYPELVASLFDESFLKLEAAPELANLLTRHHKPDPAQLAELWAKHLNSLDPAPYVALITPPAAHFLLWLESELKAAPALQPLFDSRAFESLPAVEAKIDALTEELRRAWNAALQTAEKYETSVVQRGNVNITAGRDVAIGSYVGRDNITNTTYNYNTYYFSGGFEALDEFYIRPDDVFQRVRANEFVGREWLEAEVEQFIHDPNRASGALVIIGDAGVGKTSFAAHLVRTHGYPHLFADNVGGEAKLPLAIRSLSAQLIARYRIEPYASRDALPTGPSQFDTFLSKILRLAAETATKGEKIIIVCDALDEAGTALGGNVFGLPKQLPDGVYLILTRRPAPAVKLDLEPRPTLLILDALGDDNLKDVRAFLHGKTHTPAIAGQLAAQGYTESQFVDALAQKSEGLWIYLKYVLDEIAKGGRAPLDLAKLPDGLTGYYDEFWGRWYKDVEKWDELYAPLLATLAAAQEPLLPLDSLLAWAGVKAKPYAVRRLIDDEWKAFIRRTDDERYGLYHASLRDFLRGDAARAQTDSAIAAEMRERTRATHRRIVEYYRAQCSGDWRTLAEEAYARRYLVTHLDGAGRHPELFALVAESNEWAEARYRKEEDYSGYLTDLKLAWGWAEGSKWDVGRQIRCALIESSIRSLAGNLQPELLRQVIAVGLRSSAWALAHISQMPHERQREEALTGIAPLLPDTLKAQALDAARTIQDEGVRASALTGLAPHLPDTLKAQALDAARAIQDEGARASALTGLAPHLPDHLKAQALTEALDAARAIQGDDSGASALTGPAPHLPDDLKALALDVARAIQDEDRRARTLTWLAPHLPDDLKAQTLVEALLATAKPSVAPGRGELLSQIASSWAVINFSGFEARLASEVVHAIARHRREEVLLDLAVLTPLIAHLGGQETVGQTFLAIRDVCTWWP